MAPFDTSSMITFWIPLDYVGAASDDGGGGGSGGGGGTGLYFVDRSHVDFALPFWNGVPSDDSVEGGEYGRLVQRYGGLQSIQHHMPMEVGDCTVHSGWTLHSSNGGSSSKDRYALAVTYVDAMAEVREDATPTATLGLKGTGKGARQQGHSEDLRSYQDWIGDVRPREFIDHRSLPIVWPP